MTLRQSIEVKASRTLTVTGGAVGAHVARSDDASIGIVLASGDVAVYGPYPYDTSFVLTGDATFSLSSAPAFEVDVISEDRALRQEDATKLLRATAAVTITLPADLPQGYIATVLREGSGAVTFAAGSGATVNKSASALTIASQYDSVSATVYANTDGASALWVLSGSLG